MEQWMWILIIVITGMSFTGTALIVAYAFRKKRRVEREIAAAEQGTPVSERIKLLRRKWNLLLTLYLLFCLLFIGIILYQAGQGMEERSFDCLAVLVGASFFLIQLCISRSKQKRRERATACTTATLVAKVSRMGSESGGSRYDSIYEFYAEGEKHKVRSPGVYGVEKGERVELYYIPAHPEVIYIPRVEESEKWVPVLLFGIGVILPLVGLLAPLFR